MSNPTTTNPPPTVSHSSKTSSWELPSGALGMVPQQPLRNEDGYAAWAMQMTGALRYATLWRVTSGAEVCPATDADAIEQWEWRDGAAQTMILRALDPLLHTMLQDQTSSKGYWDTLKQQFSRTSLDSAVTWMRNLTNPLSLLKDMDTHIQSFLNADRDGEPSQWLTFTAKFMLQKTTTLNETIADVRNEHRRVQANQMDISSTRDSSLNTVEAAYAALERIVRGNGRRWCRFCRREGHNYDECRSKNKQKGQQKKGKETSNVAQDQDEHSAGSADEHSHFYTKSASLRDSPVTDFAFVTVPPTYDFESTSGSRTHKSKTVVIDSGTSSHVWHSVKSDCIDIRPTSTTIRGFGNGKTTIASRGEAQVLARLPDHGYTRLRLQDTCYAPNTSPSLISVLGSTMPTAIRCLAMAAA
ncbi:hypothetical protein LXA43DRAFT_1069706 [Ganoderma leucocontextum]|nr:hypothetical protein LXA43DRAFT_1069706 [Ganoderma leucocontextum]